MRPFLGLDIGGANLKASDGEARSLSQPFPLWKLPAELAAAVSGLLREFAEPSALAVTMTGELADCFSTKAEGVRHIVGAVQQAAPGVPLLVWTTGGEFVTPDEACELVPLVAAANWHALATWAARTIPNGAAILVDIGSTTTDIIPLCDGVPVPAGRTDLERLLSGELVYTGVRRTPVAHVVAAVPFRGMSCPLSAEVFATMLDVYLLVGSIIADESDVNTANGRPATVAGAQVRLARMLCADTSEIGGDELQQIAAAIAVAQRTRIAAAFDRALARLGKPCELLIAAGEGAFVLDESAACPGSATHVPRLSLSATLGPAHAESACAYALARLARERTS